MTVKVPLTFVKVHDWDLYEKVWNAKDAMSRTIDILSSMVEQNPSEPKYEQQTTRKAIQNLCFSGYVYIGIDLMELMGFGNQLSESKMYELENEKHVEDFLKITRFTSAHAAWVLSQYSNTPLNLNNNHVAKPSLILRDPHVCIIVL